MRSRLAKLWNANALLAMYVALVAAMLFSTLARASTDPVADTRQIMAGTVTTTKAKNGYLSGANDGTTAFKGALSAYKAVRAAEPPLTVTCADGTVVKAPGTCSAVVVVPPAPTPPPTPAPIVKWTKCADENGVCNLTGLANVRYGAGSTWTAPKQTTAIACNNTVWGDPAPNVVKECDTDGTPVSVAPTPPPTPTPSGAVDVLTEGDSISFLYGGNYTGIYASTHPRVVVQGAAAGGSGLGLATDPAGANSLYGRQASDLVYHPRVVTVLIGANDLNAVGENWYPIPTIQAYADGLFAWVAPFRAAGAKVVVATVLPQCQQGDPTYYANVLNNQNRALLNPIIRAAVGTKIDAVADFAADPVMGPDAAACDLTLYRDGLHPSDGGAGGQGKLAVIYAPVVDKLLAAPQASSSDNPMVGQALGVGAPDIPTTDHDVMADLQPAWGTGAITGTNAPDVVGAFRFTCRHTNLAYDDPTVYPNQPGASHLHDQTGVYGWNAYSNYGNLRTGGGGSGCNDVAGYDRNPAETGFSANRTPYWQPALLDGKGNVILADFTGFYYKRRPLTDPIISDPANPQYQGKGVPLPNGIKFLFGANVSAGQLTPADFKCTNGTAGAVYEGPESFSAAVNCAKTHAGGTLLVSITAPDCWDGVHLDTADHRSHLAYSTYGNWGYPKCDAAHPFVIPGFTYAAAYTLLPSDDGDIHFSSDEMDSSKPRGWSFHVDYGPMAWDPQVHAMWEANCLNKLLTCTGGDLGNGKQLKGAAVPMYLANGVWTALWRNPVRLVPIPPKP